jgi:hypothetical protein
MIYNKLIGYMIYILTKTIVSLYLMINQIY